jgi:hypothetical protein
MQEAVMHKKSKTSHSMKTFYIYVCMMLCMTLGATKKIVASWELKTIHIFGLEKNRI